MSLPVFTLQSALDRVEMHLHDADGGAPAFSPWEKEAVIESHLRLLAPQLLLGDQWSTSLVPIVAGTDTYVLPTATRQDYDRLKRLRLQSNGLEIPIVSLAVFESYREGDTTSQRGTPVCAMVVQGPPSAAGPSLRFWPVPIESDTCDGFFVLLPSAEFLHDETATIPLDPPAFEALCYAAALELYGRMPEEERAKRALGPETPELWAGHVAAGVRASRHRIRRQQGGQVTLRRRRW